MTRELRHVRQWRRLPATDRQVWSGFLRAYRTVVPRLDGDLEREHRLPLSRYDVLVQASHAEGGLRMGEIADEVLLSPSGLTRLVDRLEAAGLVERRPGETDVRQVHVHVTAAGLDLLDRATTTHLRGIRDAFLDRLEPEEKRVLAAAFARIADHEPAGRRAVPDRRAR